LFIVLVLALSLTSMRGWTTSDVPGAIEMIDSESVGADGEATVPRGDVSSRLISRLVARALPTTERAKTSPDLGRVFRPPRSLGS